MLGAADEPARLAQHLGGFVTNCHAGCGLERLTACLGNLAGQAPAGKTEREHSRLLFFNVFDRLFDRRDKGIRLSQVAIRELELRDQHAGLVDNNQPITLFHNNTPLDVTQCEPSGPGYSSLRSFAMRQNGHRKMAGAAAIMWGEK
jgi:hypothetical protein